LIDQYNAYGVNGEQGLGENIADLGGITLSYYAMKEFLKDYPEYNIKVNGLTPEQRFFKQWAIGLRLAVSPSSSDKPMNEFRVDGPLTNMVEFYAAYGIKKGHPMYQIPRERVTLW
jgi:putative endopeptidase